MPFKVLVLLESDTSSSEKTYNEDSGEFVPEEDLTLCITVETSAAAGIYMSRSLTLELSSETDVKLKMGNS